MANTIHVDVVSAEESIYSGEAEFVVLPGEAGELGIYPRHIPLITRIKPGAVRIPDPCTSLYYQGNRLLHGIPPALTEDGLQILARNVLHYNEELTMVEPKIMDRDNVGMREVCGSARLLAKTLLEGIIVGIVLVQHLDRHRPFQHQVTGAEHVRHAARAEAFEQLVTIVKQHSFVHC